MKYGVIVETPFDFEIRSCYCVVKDNQKIDIFICNSIDGSAKHFAAYKDRGYEIWKHLTREQALEKIKELHDEQSVYWQQFADSKRSTSTHLQKCCELGTMINRIKMFFLPDVIESEKMLYEQWRKSIEKGESKK